MTITILGQRISPTSYVLATQQVLMWAHNGASCSVCVANVHMLMEAYDDPSFQQIIDQADLITPDGMPLVWLMRLKGETAQERVYGPTLMLSVLERAEKEGLSVGFLGSSPNVLAELIEKLHQRFPALRIGYAFSPPFRPISTTEDQQLIEQIVKSGVCILFIGLGCPKQEKWMAGHKGKIPAVMLGVGAAFDFHAGLKSQAPPFLQRLGLEWFFRLIHEPKRLWRRYLYHNPRFIFLAILDLLEFWRYR